MRLRRAAAATLGAALCLAAAEGSLRALRGAPPAEPLPPDFQYAHLDPLGPFFAADALSRPAVYRPCRRGARCASFLMPKPAGVARAFVVGASVAQPLSGEAMQSEAAPWRKTLPDLRVELLDAGMAAYDSERDLRTLEETLAYRPDLIVVMSGTNELAQRIRFPRAYLANKRLRRSWLWRLGQDALVPPPAPPAPELVERRFELRLRRMARAAKQAGVPLVLCTLPSNLRADAPAARGLPLDDETFALGWRAWEKGNVPGALERWRAAAVRRPRDPLVAFYLARALDLSGRLDEARAEYGRAARLGQAWSYRLPPQGNELIRRVAAEEGAGVADLEALFRSAAKDGIPGLDLFRDPCHFHDEYYPLAWAEILGAAQRAGALKGERWDWSWLAARRPELLHPRISRAQRELYAAMALRSALTWGMRETEGPARERTLTQFAASRRLSEAAWTRMTRSTASLAAVFDPVTALRPLPRPEPAQLEAAWPRLWAYLGEERRRDGDWRGAVAFFDRALALRPGETLAAEGRRRALARLGAKEALHAVR